jgi:broad specificity phosphatase PhoE/predicted kinase
MPNHPPVTLILRGPAGSGKTSVSLLLRDRLAPAARLSIDTLRYLVFPRVLDEQQLRVAKMNAAHMAVRFASFGISCVIESVFQKPETISEVEQILDTAGVFYQVITLKTALDTLLERNFNRYVFDQQIRERIEEVYQNYIWSIGYTIETDNRIIEEVAAEILEYLETLHPSSNGSSRNTSKYCMFVRHGECELNGDEYQAQEDVHLSAQGKAQTRQVALAIKAFQPEVLIASPFTRARETAEILSQELNLEVIFQDGLRERHFKSLAGKTYLEIEKIYSSDFLHNLLHQSNYLELPEEETIGQAQMRVVNAIEKIMRGEKQRVVIVSHGGPHSWLCAHYLGTPLAQLRAYMLNPGHFTIFEFDEYAVFRYMRTMNAFFYDIHYCE